MHMDPYGLRPLHVSFDIDACDPSIAPATGTPVKGAHALILSAAARVTCDRLCRPGGLSYREAHFILECISCAPTPNRAPRYNACALLSFFAATGRLAGLDMVEVNPGLCPGDDSTGEEQQFPYRNHLPSSLPCPPL